MGPHSLNLTLRFVLELSALLATGIWGWQQREDWLRLVIELAFFALGVWALYDLGYTTPAWVLGVLVIVHYLASYDRIRWLLSR